MSTLPKEYDGMLRLADELDEREDGHVYAHVIRNAAHAIHELQTENAKLREQIERLQPKDCEGNVLDIADTVNMLRSEYDGDHEWDDVVVELALTKWGGDRWIVRGSKGEAWACDCAKTGYDEDAYEGSDDVEPIDNPTLIELENAKLRELVKHLYECRQTYFRTGIYPTDHGVTEQRMRELGVEVDG